MEHSRYGTNVCVCVWIQLEFAKTFSKKMFYIQEKVAENLISTWNWKVFLIIDAIISTLLIAISSNFRQPIYMINGNVMLSLQKILCNANIMNRSSERWKSNYNSCTKVFGWLSNFSGQNRGLPSGSTGLFWRWYLKMT